jgi:hypothetical protein
MDASERQRLIAQYEAGPARLRQALGRVPEEALAWRPAPGEWSAHEVICHCADSESNASLRIRYLLAERDPVIVGYDQDAWATVLDYHGHPLPVALAVVEATRAHTAALIRRLPEAAWKRQGRHTESGRYSAEDWLRLYAEHLEGHARQIEANAAAWAAAGAGPGAAGRRQGRP